MINLTFKEVYTSNIYILNLDGYENINQIKELLRTSFNLTKEFELILAGTLRKEKNNPSDIILMKPNTAYYIKFKDECPVCYEQLLLDRHYNCHHTLCNTCYSSWNISCPLCRRI
jgi:hypothetical protein